MKRNIPDRHQSMVVELNSEPHKFWYLIAPPEPEVGYNEAYMESWYLTDMNDVKVEWNFSKETEETLIDLAFENKDEP